MDVYEGEKLYSISHYNPIFRGWTSVCVIKATGFDEALVNYFGDASCFRMILKKPDVHYGKETFKVTLESEVHGECSSLYVSDIIDTESYSMLGKPYDVFQVTQDGDVLSPCWTNVMGLSPHDVFADLFPDNIRNYSWSLGKSLDFDNHKTYRICPSKGEEKEFCTSRVGYFYIPDGKTDAEVEYDGPEILVHSLEIVRKLYMDTYCEKVELEHKAKQMSGVADTLADAIKSLELQIKEHHANARKNRSE